MRWPLKYQIMLPMTAVMLGTVAAVSISQAYLAAEQKREQTADRIRNVTNTLADLSTFTMTTDILDQMKGLSGADFVVTDADGALIASTRPNWQPSEFPQFDTDVQPEQFRLAKPVTIQNERLFHAAIATRPAGLSRSANTLHVFYSESVYLEERRQAVLPILGIGLLAIVTVMLLALLIASRVSKPLDQLRAQVQRMTDGEFEPIELPQRDDEVRSLSIAVNHMAETLSQYEQQIRRTEQVRLLAQLSGGLAHQLRNSATGARMALDIHRSECDTTESSESLDVATRQLMLIEKYLARFLRLGTPQPHQRKCLDYTELVNHLMPLVQPAAQHASVLLRADVPAQPLYVRGDADALEQMILNLLINAVEAAEHVPVGSATSPHDTSPHNTATSERSVAVQLRDNGRGQAVLTVEDTGPGPPSAITDTLFEPFATAKKDGVGLGLAVAREVVTEHQGQIRWQRTSESDPAQRKTRFIVEIDLVEE